MANWSGSRGIVQYSHQNKPYYNENSYQEKQNVSRLNIETYQGSFDQSTLVQARNELRYHIEHMQDTAVWYRIKQKTSVNIYGTTYFDDGFGEASNMFSHAGFHENEDEDMDQGDIGAEPQNSNLESLGKKPTQTITFSSKMSSFGGTVENDIQDKRSSLNNVTLESDKCINSKYKRLDLESDGLEIIDNEAEQDIIVVDASLNDKEESGKTFNERDELDNNNIGQLPEQIIQDRKKMTFKCDLCDFFSDSRSVMQQHLNKTIHFAASEYSVDNEGNMWLTHRKVLQNFKAKFKTVIVICPDCLKIFPDIHSCSSHCNLDHDSINDGKKDRYGLIQVFQEEVCDNSLHVLKCHHCQEYFNSKQIMRDHVRNFHHYPFSDVNNCKRIFFCVHCNTSFDSYEKVISHQDRGHWKLSKDGALKFTVFHYKNIEYHTVSYGTRSLPGTIAPAEIGTPTGSNKSSETSTSTVTGKRKHDGIATEMQREKKEMRYNTSENVIGSNNRTLNNMTENHTTRQNDPNVDTLSTPTSGKSVNGELTEIYKCDYCPKMLKDDNQMYLHLVQDVHSSASTLLLDHQGNVMYLKNTKTISFNGGNYKKIAAICNSCHLLFDTPFIYDDHNIRCHQSKGGFYYIADIVARKPIKVPISEKVCRVCKQEFKKLKQLNNHWTQSNHFPFEVRDDCYMYTLCCYCSKTFSSYKVANGHVKKHVASAKNDLLDLVILYVSKSSSKIDIPPYEATKAGELTSIRSKIDSLKQMKKICGKTGKSELTKEIQHMKQLL